MAPESQKSVPALEVTRARWCPFGTHDETQQLTIDVTDSVRRFISKDGCSLKIERVDQDTLGCDDPYPLRKKELQIWYRPCEGGEELKAVATEDQPFELKIKPELKITSATYGLLDEEGHEKSDKDCRDATENVRAKLGLDKQKLQMNLRIYIKHCRDVTEKVRAKLGFDKQKLQFKADNRELEANPAWLRTKQLKVCYTTLEGGPELQRTVQENEEILISAE